MTLPVYPSSISMSQVNTELGKSSTASIALNDSDVRTLAQVTTTGSQISMYDLYGKSNVPTSYLIGIRYLASPTSRYQSFRSYDGGTTLVDLGLLPSGTSLPQWAVSNGTTIILGDNTSTTVKYSNDSGATWGSASVTASRYWTAAQYGNGYFVVTGGSLNSTWAMYSTNGSSWTNATMPYTGFWNQLTYTPNGFWAVNQTGYQAYSSTGATWSGSGQLTLPASSSVTDCVYANGYYMVLTGTGSTNIIRSTNGTSWSTIAVSTTYKGQALSYVGNGVWIISSENNNNKIARSTDNGSTWSVISLPGTNVYNNGKVIYDSLGNLYLKSSDYSTVFKSTDAGASWTNLTSPTQNGFYLATAGTSAISTWQSS